MGRLLPAGPRSPPPAATTRPACRADRTSNVADQISRPLAHTHLPHYHQVATGIAAKWSASSLALALRARTRRFHRCLLPSTDVMATTRLRSLKLHRALRETCVAIKGRGRPAVQ